MTISISISIAKINFKLRNQFQTQESISKSEINPESIGT